MRSAEPLAVVIGLLRIDNALPRFVRQRTIDLVGR
jgi:hypothetical protein